MLEKQKTISGEVSLRGKGLHSGKDVKIIFKPARPNFGIRFKRTDLENRPEIESVAENVVSTARGTTIEQNGAQVMTIEHVCAALAGLGIDNILIEVDNAELPIMDGSSKVFVQELKKAGIQEQDAERVYYTFKEKIIYRDDKNDIEIIAYPNENYSIDVHIDFKSKVLGTQSASLNSLGDFEKEISACKTFVFLHEVEALFKNNLIKGGDLDNALVIVEKPMVKKDLDELAELFNRPKIEVLPEGYLNNTERVFQNEAARHKLLDVVGDLTLIGMPIKAKIVAKKPGHHANTEFAKIVRKMIKHF